MDNSNVYLKVSHCFSYLFLHNKLQDRLSCAVSLGVFCMILIRWWLGLESSEGIFSHRSHTSAGMAETAGGWEGMCLPKQLSTRLAWASKQHGILKIVGLLHEREVLLE